MQRLLVAAPSQILGQLLRWARHQLSAIVRGPRVQVQATHTSSRFIDLAEIEALGEGVVGLGDDGGSEGEEDRSEDHHGECWVRLWLTTIVRDDL